MFIVQVDTLKCPQKGASVVPWDSLSPADQIFFGGGLGLQGPPSVEEGDTTAGVGCLPGRTCQ